MHLPTYLMLLGAALLVAHLKGVDAFTLDRPSSGDTQRVSLESVEKACNQTLSEDSNEEEDVRDSSQVEEDNIAKRSAQFSSNSDEFDNDSFELNDRRTFQQNVPSQTAQQANIRNFVFRNSNERDISDEVRSIFATPQITRITPTRTSTLPDRLPVPISLRNQPIRRFDDDDSIEIFRIVSTPTQQIAPVRTTLLSNRMPIPISLRTPISTQTFDFDDDSIEFRDRIITPIQRTASTQTATVSRVVGARRPNVFRQSDERDDISVESFSFLQNGQLQTAIRPVQQTNNRAQLIQTVRVANGIAAPQAQSPAAVVNQTPTTVSGFNLVFTDSAEQDDFSDEVIRSSLLAFATPVTPTPPSRLPVAIGLRNQNIRPSIVNANRVTVISAPARQIVPTQTVDQVAPIQTSNRIVPVQTVNQAVSVQTTNRIVPTQTVNQVAPVQRLNQVVPIQTINRVAPVQTVNRIVPVQTVSRIVTTPTVSRVFPIQTINLPNRLPVPLAFRNFILRQTIDFDDDSIEIRDRNVFSTINTNTGQVRTLTSVSRPFLSQDDDDISVELELVRTVQNQPIASVGQVSQSAAGNTAQTTGNQGQQLVLRFDDDFSLEDDSNEDINESSFFLEDQMDSADSFRFLATDFLLQPDTNRGLSARSVNNGKQAKDNDEDYTLETKLPPTHPDETDLHESVAKESDDWFLVKQYMNHDYSSEELEGELAMEYFWQPVKDSSKKTV